MQPGEAEQDEGELAHERAPGFQQILAAFSELVVLAAQAVSVQPEGCLGDDLTRELPSQVLDLHVFVGLGAVFQCVCQFGCCLVYCR